MEQSNWVKRFFPTLLRWTKRGVLIAVAVLIVLLIVHTVLNVVLHKRVEAKLAEIRRSGGAVTLSELLPDPIPDQQNAAIHYFYALSIMKRALAEDDGSSERRLDAFDISLRHCTVSGKCPRVEEHDIQTAREYLEKVQPDVEADGREIELAARHIFKRMERGLQVVKEARALRRAQVLPDYDLSPDVAGRLIMLALARLRVLSRWVAGGAVLEARDGDVKEAFELISAALHLANGLNNEPMLIAQLVRIAIGGIAVNAMQEVLNENHPPDEHVHMIVVELNELRDRSHFVRALQGERCFIMEHYREPVTLNYVAGPIRLLDVLAYLEYTAEIEQFAASPSYRSRDALDELEHEIGTISKLKVAARILIPSLLQVLQSQDRFVSQCDLAEMAIYLKQYKEKTSSYPEKIDEIVPEFIKELPIDPFNGKRYVYCRKGEGFVLYGVSRNRVDDGGKPDGDVVWHSSR